MDVLKVANGPVMWFFSFAIVAAAAMQAIVLYQYARKYIAQTNLLSADEIRTCIKTGGVVAIGPALSVFVVALSMISMLGAPFALMRVGMIGSASTELTAASIGAEAAGVALGIDSLTMEAFTAALWTCALMSCGYLIFVPLVTRGVGKALNNIVVPPEGQKQSRLAWVLSALLPCIIFLGLSTIQATKSTPHLCSLILSGVMMLLLNVIAMKYKKKWLSQWAMCLSVLFGIVVGAVTNALV